MFYLNGSTCSTSTCPTSTFSTSTCSTQYNDNKSCHPPPRLVQCHWTWVWGSACRCRTLASFPYHLHSEDQCWLRKIEIIKIIWKVRFVISRTVEVRKICDSQGLVQSQQKWPGVDPKIPGACHICPNCHKDSRWNILRPYQSGGRAAVAKYKTPPGDDRMSKNAFCTHREYVKNHI